MTDDSAGRDRGIERYREYLRLLVTLQLDPAFQGKIDPSGVVQQTMLEAYQAFPEGGIADADHLAAWLRRILANNLADEIRKLRRGKRDVTRERSLEAALEQSSNRLHAWLAAEQSSPSQHARRREQALRVSEALASLSEAQREALVLRHFHGRSLAEIAERLGRTHAAVAGLLKRGLQQLRNQLREPE